MLQLDFLTELFKKAKARKIHTCLDTSGAVFSEQLLPKIYELMKYTDLVMLDIKHIDEEAHIKLTGKPNKNILDFAQYLSDKKIPVWIRHVLVPGITLDEGALLRLGRFIGTLENVKRIEVLPYHSMGKYKYEKLKIPYPLENIPDATNEQAQGALKIIESAVKTY